MEKYSLPAVFAVILAVLCAILPCQGGEKKKNNGVTYPEWMSHLPRIPKYPDKKTYNEFKKKNGRRDPANGTFPKKVADCTLTEDQLPELVKGHPRLIVRPTTWKYGLSVDQFRERAKQDPWASGIRSLAKKSAKRYCSSLAKYYLATGDESVVPKLIEWIMNIRGPGYGMSGEPFITYDWIYNSTYLAEHPDEKKKLEDKLVKLAWQACGLLESSGNCGEIWRHRGGGGIDPLLAGFALAGEHPEGKKLLAAGMGYWLKAYIPAYEMTGGGWLGGQHSYVGMVTAAPKALACWASAVESQDIYEVIRKEYSNWLEHRMYFWMHIFYPDKSPINGVGTTHCNWKHYHDQFTLMSKAYGNPDGYEFMRWKGIDPKRDIFFYDAELDKKAASGVFTKPYSHLYGRNGLGYVQMRSKGWESDSTIVDIKFSKYLWNHALQSNQGSFTIYHKGRLAMQTGTYDSFGGTDHWDYYYRRTIASCNMLIFVPGEFSGGGGPSAEKEHGFVKEPGGQCAGSMGRHNFTFKEWEWHVKHDPRYDWSQVTAYEHAPDFAWTYVSGDVTKAYSSPHRVSFREKRNLIVHNVPKIDLYTRSLVYIPGPNNVVIFDRVNTLDPSYRKAWLLHSIGKPDVNGKVIKSQAPGHHEDFDGDIAMNTWPGGISKPADVNDPGRLFVRTLLPKKHYIRRIGGKGYECWSMGANRTPYPEGHRNRKYLKGRDGQEIFADVYNEKQNRGYDLANWRIEVSPSEPKQFDNFLHLLHICDTKTKEMPASEMVESSDGNMAGVVSQGWLVMFGKKGEVAGEVSYKAPKNKTEHLVVDLKRGGKYQVSGIVGGKKLMTASKEGTLRFRSEAEGTIHISPRK